MKRILFSGDGSSGDLLPHVLMASEFQRAGYEVCVCGSGEFAQMAKDFDVPFAAYPHNYSKLYLDEQRTGYIWNIREAIRHQEMLYQGEYDLLSQIAPQFDVLINFLAELFTPSAAEAFGLANIKLMTFPMVPSDRYGVPAGIPFISENRWWNKLTWEGATFGATHFAGYGKTVNRLRNDLGLAPIRNLLAANARCDHLMVGLYEELLPPCPSWSGYLDYTYIGACLPNTKVSLSRELEDFLAKGSKPVYVGFGSMRHQGADALTHQIVESLRSAGVRAILAQNASEVGADLRDSEDVYVLREYPIPHHILYPRCLAAVHQGSYIATHLAAQAGIPQLAVAQATDQYLWADRIRRAGVGPAGVDMNRLTTRKLSAAIEKLTQTQSYVANAKAISERVAGIDGAKNALALFERLKNGLASRTQVSLAGA